MREVLGAKVLRSRRLSYAGVDVVATLTDRLQHKFGTSAVHASARHLTSGTSSGRRVGLTAGPQDIHGRGVQQGGASSLHSISFFQFDVLQEPFWPADLVVIRDLLFHFTPKQVRQESVGGV